MPSGLTLTPKEAAHIAANAYFTLKDWIREKPVAGTESRANVENRVLGTATVGAPSHGNTSLAGTGLASATLGHVHTAETGFGTTSGFGYTLSFTGGGRKHVIFATRGTRPEMAWKPDLLTDARGAMTSFGDYGVVHKGFKVTFDSILPNIMRDRSLVETADVVHCVGHSLGGAVATLLAGHFAAQGRAVRLYTFGSPRVGALGAHAAIQQRIGAENIFRVAHDLDPISLVAPFPYVHVLPSPSDENNMTLLSPTGRLFSTANHDMAEYIRSVGTMEWTGVRRAASLVDHDDALVARWLLHEDNNPGWVQYASARTLSLLFKLFRHVLSSLSVSIFLGLSAVDLLAEVLMKGLHKIQEMGTRLMRLLRYAATWAGVKVAEGADIGGEVIRTILKKMLSALKDLGSGAVAIGAANLAPMAVSLGGAFAMSSYGMI